MFMVYNFSNITLIIDSYLIGKLPELHSFSLDHVLAVTKKVPCNVRNDQQMVGITWESGYFIRFLRFLLVDIWTKE